MHAMTGQPLLRSLAMVAVAWHHHDLTSPSVALPVGLGACVAATATVQKRVAMVVTTPREVTTTG
eukprot:4517484-Alexandrium_andersonii.AAC.1